MIESDVNDVIIIRWIRQAVFRCCFTAVRSGGKRKSLIKQMEAPIVWIRDGI